MQGKSAAGMTIAALVVLYGTGFAYHFELVEVSGTVTAGVAKQQTIPILCFDSQQVAQGEVSVDCRNSVASGSASTSLQFDGGEFLFTSTMTGVSVVDSMAGWSSIEDLSCEVVLVADTGDVAQPLVTFEWSKNEGLTGEGFSGITGQVRKTNPFGVVARFHEEQGVFFSEVVPAGTRFTIIMDQFTASSYDTWAGCFAGGASVDFRIAVTIDECGTGTGACPQPKSVVVDAAFTRYSNVLQDIAVVRMRNTGWDATRLDNPTKEELHQALADPCVRGLHLMAHGVEGSISGLSLRKAGGGRENVEPSYFESAIAGRRMDFIAPLACNQWEDAWRHGGFSGVRDVVMPLRPSGQSRTVLDGTQYWAAQASGFSIDALPCADVGPAVMVESQVGSIGVEVGYGTDCSAIGLCNDTGCGHDIYPAVVCASNSSFTVNGLIAVDAPDGSFTIEALYPFPMFSVDAVIYGTLFSAVPADLMPDTMSPISRFINVGAATAELDFVPDLFNIVMRYDESDLTLAGITDELSLGAYWVSESNEGEFVSSEIDTALNTVSFSVTEGGIGGIYGNGGISGLGPEIPMAFDLHKARPNPFNPRTTIAFELGKRETVTLRIFDVSGRLVRVLVDGEVYEPGRHEAVWSGRDNAGRQLASGTYFYNLESGGYSETKRMVLLK